MSSRAPVSQKQRQHAAAWPKMKDALEWLAVKNHRLVLVGKQYAIAEIGDGSFSLKRQLEEKIAQELVASRWVDGVYLPMFPDGGGRLTSAGRRALGEPKKPRAVHDAHGRPIHVGDRVRHTASETPLGDSIVE